MAQRKLPDLSATQLIASGAATLVAAYGASYLGVYGTILGAAFTSVVSTAASVIGKHYLDQGKEQIRERTHLVTGEHEQDPGEAARSATAADATRAAGSPLTAEVRASGSTRIAETRVAGAGAPKGHAAPPAPRVGGGDPNRTRVDDPSGRPALAGDPNATRLDLPSLGDAALADPNATRFGASAADATRLDRTPAEIVAAELAAEAGDAPQRQASWQAALDDSLLWAKQRWKLLTASAVVVFVVVIGGITLYESVTDKTFGGVKGSGGTIGNVIRGQNEGSGGGTTHEPSHKPTDGPTAPGTSTPDGKPTDQPTDQPSGGPTEKPSESPSVPQTPTNEPTNTPTHEPTTAPSGGAGDGQTGGGGASTGKPGLQAPPQGN